MEGVLTRNGVSRRAVFFERVEVQGTERNDAPQRVSPVDALDAGILVEQILPRLTRKQRSVIQMAFFEGMKLSEVADRSGESIGNIRHAYYRGMDKLRSVILACKRAPNGAVCLESALQFHGILPSTPGPVWMAVDRKARKPIVDGRQLRFVRFSGRALTQGVLNIRIAGVHVRIFSTAKTVADCLKYRNKIGIETAIRAFQSSVRLKKCSRERLAHFAEICRVGSSVRQMYALEKSSATSRHPSRQQSSQTCSHNNP